MRLLALALAFAATGCATMPDVKDGGLAIARTGWRMSGGADFERKAWFVMFWRPWGQAESDAAAAADKIVLP